MTGPRSLRAHGATTAALVSGVLPDGVSKRDLGEARLGVGNPDNEAVVIAAQGKLIAK